MGPGNLERTLLEFEKPRTTLYLNNKRVKDIFDQIGGKDESSISRELAGEVGAGVPAWLASIVGKISGKKGQDEKKQIADSPPLMAAMLESYFRRSRKLIDLSNEKFWKAEWLKYVGESCITMPDDDVTTINAGLPAHLSQVIQTERERQQRIIRYEKEDAKTIVWTSAGEPYLASIADTRWVNFTNMASDYYARMGVFGNFESQIENVVFISPLWIWYETITDQVNKTG